MNSSTRTKLSEQGPGLGRLAAIAGAALSLPLPRPTRRTEPFLAHSCDNICAKICARRSIMRIVCAWRAYFAESDASENRVEVCSNLWSIFRVRELSLCGIGLCDASPGAVERSSKGDRSTASARGLKIMRISAYDGMSMRENRRAEITKFWSP